MGKRNKKVKKKKKKDILFLYFKLESDKYYLQNKNFQKLSTSDLLAYQVVEV